jgi:CHAD domain-containing protein
MAGPAEGRPLDDPVTVVLHAQLRRLVGAIERSDPAVRTGRRHAIHDMRVALRRLRSTLATNRRFLDPAVVTQLTPELRWVGSSLAEARDAQVQAARLPDLLADHPDFGSGRDVVSRELDRRYETAHASAVGALSSDRFHQLLVALEALRASPTWTAAAHQSVGDALALQPAHEFARLSPLVRSARQSSDPAVRGERLHDVRKAAKRARYAAKPLVPYFGVPVKEIVRRAKWIQLVLGEHQDTVAARALLEQLRGSLRAGGLGVDVVDALQASESRRAETLEVQFFERWLALSRAIP